MTSVNFSCRDWRFDREQLAIERDEVDIAFTMPGLAGRSNGNIRKPSLNGG